MPGPKIAVLLDENTSSGGKNYDLSKDYFSAVSQAGGEPYGIPYLFNMVSGIINFFDGFFSVGGSVALPAEWYAPGQRSPFPSSERTAIEIEIMKRFLAADKPVLGACNGMQVLAGLNGCKLRSDLGGTIHQEGPHKVALTPDSQIARIISIPSLEVNSRHREAVAKIGPSAEIGALAPDGTIEAIEIPHKRFAIGYQWHQENFWRETHPGNALFTAFVNSAKEP
jgi:putative glutamine amidotransferase